MVLVGSCASAAGVVAAGGVRPTGDQLPPPLLPAPEGRTRGTGRRPAVVQRFALRCVAEDSCPSTAGASLCRAAAARSSAEGARARGALRLRAAAAERCTKTFAGSPGGLTLR